MSRVAVPCQGLPSVCASPSGHTSSAAGRLSSPARRAVPIPDVRRGRSMNGPTVSIESIKAAATALRYRGCWWRRPDSWSADRLWRGLSVQAGVRQRPDAERARFRAAAAHSSGTRRTGRTLVITNPTGNRDRSVEYQDRSSAESKSLPVFGGSPLLADRQRQQREQLRLRAIDAAVLRRLPRAGDHTDNTSALDAIRWTDLPQRAEAVRIPAAHDP